MLIDQEGGRVQRLRPPHWRDTPAALRFGALYAVDPQAARDAARLNARLIAEDSAIRGHRRRLPAGPRPAARGCARGDLGPRLRQRPGARRGPRPGRMRGAFSGGSASGDQAYTRSWTGHGRQPSGPCRGSRRRWPSCGRATSHPSGALNDMPIAMTSHVGLRSARRPGAGDHLCPGHRRNDPPRHRVRRAAPLRRHFDAGLKRRSG